MMNHTFAILQTAVTKATIEKSYVVYSHVTLIFTNAQNATSDVTRFQLQDFNDSLKYGAIFISPADLPRFMLQTHNANIFTRYTVYLETTETDPKKFQLSTLFHEIVYPDQNTATRASIVDADQAHCNYPHLSTQSGSIANSAYHAMYRPIYYDHDAQKENVPHVHFQSPHPTAPTDASWNQPPPYTTTTCMPSSALKQQTSMIQPKASVTSPSMAHDTRHDKLKKDPKVQSTGTIPKTTVKKTKNSAKTSKPTQAKSRSERDSNVEEFDMLSLRSVQFSSDSDDSDSSSDGEDVMKFGFHMRSKDRRARRHFLLRWLWCSQQRVEKQRGKIELESYAQRLLQDLEKLVLKPKEYTKEEILRAGMRIKSGQPKNKFSYRKNEVERVKSPGQLCEFLTSYWDIDPMMLIQLVGQLTRLHDVQIASLLSRVFTDIQKGMKKHKKPLLDIYIGHRCKNCTYNKPDADHHHDYILDALFKLEGGALFRRCLLLTSESLGLKYNIQRDDTHLVLQLTQ